MRRLALATLCLSLAGSMVLTGCAGSKPEGSEGSAEKTPAKKKAELEAEVIKSRQEAEAQEKRLTALREEKAQLEAELERKNNPGAFSAPAPKADTTKAAAKPAAATAPATAPAATTAKPAAKK